MSEFTDKKPGEDIFQLKGVFCFYSPEREGKGYDTVSFLLSKSGDQAKPVFVNYHGTMLSDGTPGGVSGDVIVRPDGSHTYELMGKTIGKDPNCFDILEEVDVAREVAAQRPKVQEPEAAAARPSAALARAVQPKHTKPKNHLSADQQRQQKYGRNNFNARQKTNTRLFVPR